MRIVKRKSKRAAYDVRDKVRTLRGEGIIKYVFSRGPHGKSAYSVDFGSKRVGVIFGEDELTLIKKSNESLQVK